MSKSRISEEPPHHYRSAGRSTTANLADVQNTITEMIQEADSTTQQWQKAIKPGDLFFTESEGIVAYVRVYGPLESATPDEVDHLRETYAQPHLQNYRAAQSFSPYVPRGEHGDVHVNIAVALLSPEQFETARSKDWPQDPREVERLFGIRIEKPARSDRTPRRHVMHPPGATETDRLSTKSVEVVKRLLVGVPVPGTKVMKLEPYMDFVVEDHGNGAVSLGYWKKLGQQLAPDPAIHLTAIDSGYALIGVQTMFGMIPWGEEGTVGYAEEFLATVAGRYLGGNGG